jgi:hypothetical protein
MTSGLREDAVSKCSSRIPWDALNYVHLGRSFNLNSYHYHYLASSLDFNFGEKPSRSKSCLFLPLCRRILDRSVDIEFTTQ